MIKVNRKLQQPNPRRTDNDPVSLGMKVVVTPLDKKPQPVEVFDKGKVAEGIYINQL